MSNDATPIICKADQTITSFDDDKLGLRPLAESLTRVIQSQTDPFVLAIDSPWGTGKTTFLNMWKKMLDEQDYPCLYFNAWENDFVDDPLAAFFGELEGLVDELVKHERGAALKTILDDAKKYGKGLYRNIIPVLLSIATRGAIKGLDLENTCGAFSADNIEKVSEAIINNIITNYREQKNSFSHLRAKLEDFAGRVRSETRNQGPLLIIVDELDRCRPDFAVALLERVKHVFGVRNIFFVLAMDFEALSSAVSRIYGQKMEDTGYLQRFFDYKFVLPEPDYIGYAGSVFRRLLPEKTNPTIINIFSILSVKLRLSLRHQNRCITTISMLFKAVPFRSILNQAHDYAIAFTIIMLPAFLMAFDVNLFKTLKSGGSIINQIYPDPINAVRSNTKHEELILIALLWLIDKKIKFGSTEFQDWIQSAPRGMAYDEEVTEEFELYTRIENSVSQALINISSEQIHYLFKLVETLGRS